MNIRTDKDIVVETLRKLAQFGILKADDLYMMADEIMRSDMAESQGCPMCDETQCDGDCPLRMVRPINGKLGP